MPYEVITKNATWIIGAKDVRVDPPGSLVFETDGKVSAGFAPGIWVRFKQMEYVLDPGRRTSPPHGETVPRGGDN